MTISYLISTKGNILYDGKFKTKNSYKTFGQHSFVYDLLASLARKKINVRLYTDDINLFPLTKELHKLEIEIFHLNFDTIIKSDIILLDTLTDNQINIDNLVGLKVGIIHNYLLRHTEKFYEFSDFLICMTERAKERQNIFYTSSKYRVIKQGIDLDRFKEKGKRSDSQLKNVLIYSRMDEYKGEIYELIIELLLTSKYKVSILGDGILFNRYKTIFSKKINVLKYCPCFKIHDTINKFDIIISNGRGVMEGIAMNKPTICAGINYGGLVNHENLNLLFESNFTGSNLPKCEIKLLDDLEKINEYKGYNYQELAIQHFDVDIFIEKLLTIN